MSNNIETAIAIAFFGTIAIGTVVLHKREQLLRILGPPKVQVSKCSKKCQSGDRSLLIIHEI